MNEETKIETSSKYDFNCLVVTDGYFGAGKTVKQAAENCRKAGSPLRQSAYVVICDKPVKFLSIMQVEYPEGAPNFRTEFKSKTLSSLL